MQYAGGDYYTMRTRDVNTLDSIVRQSVLGLTFLAAGANLFDAASFQ